MTYLFWQKPTFSSSTKLFQNSEQVGVFNFGSFSTNSSVLIKGQTYSIEPQGFGQKVLWIDTKDFSVIAEIYFEQFSSLARIVYNNEIYVYKDKILMKDGQLIAKCNTKTFSEDGNIESPEDNLILMLSTYYIHQYKSSLISFFVTIISTFIIVYFLFF